MAKLVHITSEEDEYKTFREVPKAKGLSVFCVSQTLEKAGWAIFEKRSDKEYSFTDSTSLALMDAEAIRNAFTFDEHFSKEGYNVIP